MDIRGDGGADHIDPVQRGFGGYFLLVAAVAEDAIGDLPGEMLADLVLADDFPDPDPDLVRVLEPAGRCRRSRNSPWG